MGKFFYQYFKYIAVIDKSKKRLSREVNPVEVRGHSTGPDGPTVSLIPDMLPVHQENSRESSTSITSSSVRSSSTTTTTPASSSTVAPNVTAGTSAATRAKTSSSPTSKPAAAQKDQRILPIVDNLENVVNNKGKNNKNEQENDKVNLSSEPDNSKY